MTVLSLSETMKEQARLRTLADELLPAYARTLIERVQPELDAFLRVHRWNIEETHHQDWQFPNWLKELVNRSRDNLSLTVTVRRHDINRHGFTSYKKMRSELKRLAERWKGVIQIQFAYFNSNDALISDSTFARQTKDVSAYMRIYFFAFEYGNPDNRNYS